MPEEQTDFQSVKKLEGIADIAAPQRLCAKGCGGTVGFGAVAVVAVVSGFGTLIFRKKED